jgi:hypothetical protein
MQSPETTVPENEATPPAPARTGAIVPDFSGPAVPIGQLTELPDWPRCALGTHVSIHGFEGVVMEIINQSIRVVSADRISQRFNANRLKMLFAPPDRSWTPPPSESPKPVAPPEVAPDEPEAELPQRVYIAEPDFSEPIRAIRTYASEAEFPQCAYGKHVDISGYEGVVVEIVGGSLKVQALEGHIRSYNAVVLKKLYGRD